MTKGTNTSCCARIHERRHLGAYRCERSRFSRVAFETGARDCHHRTCGTHSRIVDGLRLCEGCDAERTARQPRRKE